MARNSGRPTETEATFQGAVIELAQRLGFRVAHFRAARTKHGWRTPVAADGEGFPDLVLVRERVVWAELKREGEDLRSAQEKWRDWLLAAGEEWYMWRPSDWDEIMNVLSKVDSPKGEARYG